eukprot:10262171-Alexandrium_andersonii.AAC.1
MEAARGDSSLRRHCNGLMSPARGGRVSPMSAWLEITSEEVTEEAAQGPEPARGGSRLQQLPLTQHGLQASLTLTKHALRIEQSSTHSRAHPILDI